MKKREKGEAGQKIALIAMGLIQFDKKHRSLNV
jgi:hypothetical protein